MESILGQFKLASFESYLKVCGFLLSQTLGQTVSIGQALGSHLELLTAAEAELRARVCLEELPEAVLVPADALVGR